MHKHTHYEKKIFEEYLKAEEALGTDLEQLKTGLLILSPRNYIPLLYKDTSEYIRAEIAIHPVTPPSILKKLAHDSDILVRRRTARNPHTPKETLNTLLKNKDLATLLFILENESVTREIVEKLSHDEMELISQTAKKKLRSWKAPTRRKLISWKEKR